MWWKIWRKRQLKQVQLRQHDQLLQEIEEARANWQHAWGRLEYAHGADEIDYAIFSLQAAEQRYGMLLRMAKQDAVCTKIEQQPLKKERFSQPRAAADEVSGQRGALR